MRNTWPQFRAAANIYRPDALAYTKTAPEGVAVGFKNGMDLICGDYRNNLTTDADNIVKAVKSGLLPEKVLDRSVARLMEARIRLGMFDPPEIVPYTKYTIKDNDTPEHSKVALELARPSTPAMRCATVYPSTSICAGRGSVGALASRRPSRAR